MRICKICKSKEKNYAKNMCKSCYLYNYNRKPHIKKLKKEYYIKKLKGSEKWRRTSRERMRKMRAKKHFNLTSEEYDKLTRKCLICGFEIIVELHHKDRNIKNNEISNLVGLCPNHHRMAHMNLLNKVFFQ